MPSPAVLAMLGAGESAPPFDPLTIPDLAAWYDASDASTFTYSSGSVVSQWDDKSGNGYHIAQATVGKQPSRTGTQNSLATVVFADIGRHLYLAMGTPIFADNICVFSVWKQTGTLPTYLKAPATTDNGSNLARPLDRWHQSGGPDVFIVNAAGYSASLDLRSQSAHFVHMLSAARVAAVINERANAVATSTDRAFTSSDWGSIANQRISVGGRSDGAVGFVGELAEAIYINGIPSTTDRDDIENYMADKWGITL